MCANACGHGVCTYVYTCVCIVVYVSIVGMYVDVCTCVNVCRHINAYKCVYNLMFTSVPKERLIFLPVVMNLRRLT